MNDDPNEPNNETDLASSYKNLDPRVIWIGSDAMKHLVEMAQRKYDGYFHKNGDDSIDDGLRKIEEALHEFLCVSELRVRLIFGPSDNPDRELDLSKVATEQGSFATDEVQLFIDDGAAIIADVRDRDLSPWA